MLFRVIRRIGVALTATAWLAAAPVAAQTADDEQSLRQVQAEQFRDMFDDPDNVEKMFAYARTSIRLRDYEAAISTLDRILIYNPDQPRVKLELGAAYFRIGSYTIAQHYFEAVRDDPAAPAEIKPRAEEFLTEINRRTATSSFSGVVSARFIATNNANNGPDSRLIDFEGVQVRLTGTNVTSQSDVGGSFSLSMTHVADLGGSNADAWRTNFALYSARFAETPTGDADVVVLRTGPQLSLDDERYGPKIRPFAELDHVRSNSDALYSTAGIGAEYTDTLNDRATAIGDVRVGWRDYHDEGARDLDRAVIRGTGGLLYFLSDQTSLRGLLGVSVETGADDRENSAEGSATASLNHFYDSGLEIAGRRWLITASARAGYREHFAFDTGPGVRRKDFTLNLGVGHIAFLKEGVALNINVDYFLRDSNSRNFDLDSLTLSAGASYYF